MTRHSAQVEMELHLDGRIFSVGQIGSGFLMLSPPVDLAPGVGEVMLRIDGTERRFPVRLDQGAISSRTMTPVTLAALVEPSFPTSATSAA